MNRKYHLSQYTYGNRGKPNALKKRLWKTWWKTYGKPYAKHYGKLNVALRYYFCTDIRALSRRLPYHSPSHSPSHKFTTRFTTAIFKSVLRFPTVPTGSATTYFACGDLNSFIRSFGSERQNKSLYLMGPIVPRSRRWESISFKPTSFYCFYKRHPHLEYTPLTRLGQMRCTKPESEVIKWTT